MRLRAVRRVVRRLLVLLLRLLESQEEDVMDAVLPLLDAEEDTHILALFHACVLTKEVRSTYWSCLL